MTTKAPTPPSTAPRPAAAKAAPLTVREMQHLMGCKPGCACRCNAAFCACRERAVIPAEPSAADRANGARVAIRKAA